MGKTYHDITGTVGTTPRVRLNHTAARSGAISGIWRRFPRGACLLALSALAFGLRAAEPPPRSFDIPAGAGKTTLESFAKQAKVEVIYSADKVEGVKTNSVKGDYTPRQALEQLVAETGLVVVQDPKSGALTVTKPAPATRKENTTENEPPFTEGRPTMLERVDVSTTRIDGLNNKGLLQAGANAPLYHEVVTRLDIERMGVSSLEELFRYIPQTSSASTFMQAPAGFSNVSGGLTSRTSTVGLRGFDSSQTVVLVNGRALPRSGLGSNGGADIARIPIAAIERVEILPYAGSAIYGAGALGGAINVILRKEYTGRDLTTYFGTSTDGGATEYRATYLEGRSFNGGKTNLTYALSYQHREALRANQRDYLDDAFRRYGPDSTAVNPQGQRLFETLILPAFAGSPATILIQGGATSGDLGIPGAAGVRYAGVPAGLTAAQALALTPGSFTATAGKPTLSPRYGRSILYEPIESFSVNAQLEHEFVKDKLNAYGEFTVGQNRKSYSMPQQLVEYLDADDPLNPFRNNVTPGFAGRAVTVFLDSPDLPDPSILYKDESARAVLGLKGQITERWEWSVDGVLDYSHSLTNSKNPSTDLIDLNDLDPYADPGPSAPAEVRRAIYPLFSDHTKYPISQADADKYFGTVRRSASHGLQWEGNARVMGEVFNLPAGPLRASAVGKYQHWDFVSGQLMDGSDATSRLIHNVGWDTSSSSTPGTRKIRQGAVEVSVPVISKQWQPLPIEGLDLQGSLSRELDTSSGLNSEDKPFTNKQSATSSVVAVKLQVTRDVALRASYSEGFYPPNWWDVSAPTTEFPVGGYFPDPKRGNTMQFTPMIAVKQGGNPNLTPEKAKSDNFGVILTPRWLPNLTLNLDYWKIKKTDAVVSTSFVDIIANPDAFGFLITRQAPGAGDPAGWLGRITAVDARAFNASVTDTEGIDVGLRYNEVKTAVGTFEFAGSASFTNKFLLATTPTAPIVNTAGGSGPIRWRGNASATWLRGRWSATITGRYVGHHSTSTTAPSESYPGASSLDGGRIPAYLHWDLQASYEIPYGIAAADGWKTWFSGAKFTLGMLNVLNDKPAFLSSGAFYDGADDPRQRYVYLQVKKSF